MMRLARALKLIDDLQRLTGRIADKQRFRQQPGRRAHQLEVVCDRAAQPVGAEPLGCDCSAELIAMSEYEFAVALLTGALAIADADELGRSPQACGQRMRQLRAPRGVAAFNADQDQARCQT